MDQWGSVRGLVGRSGGEGEWQGRSGGVGVGMCWVVGGVGWCCGMVVLCFSVRMVYELFRGVVCWVMCLCYVLCCVLCCCVVLCCVVLCCLCCVVLCCVVWSL